MMGKVNVSNDKERIGKIKSDSTMDIIQGDSRRGMGATIHILDRVRDNGLDI